MVGLRACPFAAGRLAALSGQVDKAVQVWPGAKVACRAGGPVLSTTFCPPLDWTIFFWLDWIPVLSGQIQALRIRARRNRGLSCKLLPWFTCA